MTWKLVPPVSSPQSGGRVPSGSTFWIWSHSCAEVTLIKYAPMGDPMELRIHGYELTLRRADGEKVELSPIATRNTPTTPKEADRSPEIWLHPGLGEGGQVPCESR